MNDFGSVIRDEAAPSGNTFNNVAGRQLRQRFRHSDAADLILFHHIVFGHDLIARLEDAVGDFIPYIRLDFFI